jgi:hypothetical protein
MDLKQKAEKLGFISKIKLIHENLKSPDTGELESLLYYLWKCELQKWLREIHNIIVFVAPLIPDCNEFGVTIYSNKYSCELNNAFYKTYEEALEIGLQEALKLIPDGKKD